MIDARPRLRGRLHQGAAVVAAVVGAVLVVRAPTARAALAVAVFAASHTVQLTVSALYHRVIWSAPARARMRRADHAAIFLLIAGSATPFALLSMPSDLGVKLMALLWGGGAIGVAVMVAWPNKPKWLMAVFCVVLGWAGTPIWLDARATIDVVTVALLCAAGTAYSAGAVCYALRRPRLVPAVFGYHEVFHALTLVAAVGTFVAVARIAL